MPAMQVRLFSFPLGPPPCSKAEVGGNGGVLTKMKRKKAEWTNSSHAIESTTTHPGGVSYMSSLKVNPSRKEIICPQVHSPLVHGGVGVWTERL